MGKIFGPHLKKKKKLGLIKIFGGPYFRALSFYGKIFWALFKKKKGLQLKK
jgi:hypothetical protein